MGVRNLTVYITGDPSDLRSTLRQAARDVSSFVDDTNRKGSSLGEGFKRGGKGAAAGIGLVIGALAAAATGAADFEVRMRNVNTIQQQSEDGFRATSQAVIDLSRTVPQAASTLADGLYEISSSGFAGAEGLNVLENAAKAATAGLSTTDTASKAITAVLNAYGLSAASAKDVSDTLFQTVNAGVVTFEELAEQVGDFVGIGAAAGVSFGEMGAGLAAITLSGIPAAQAATSLNYVVKSLIQPSDALAQTLRDLGYESGAQALQVDGLRGVMDKLREATGGNVEELTQLFPSVEAAQGAFALMANEGQNLARAYDQVADRTKTAGATQRAFDEQMKAAGNSARLALNDLKATGLQIGVNLLPPFTAFLELARETGQDAVPLIQEGFRAVQPVLAQTWRILGDVVSVLGDLADAGAPVAAVLGGLVAAGTLGALRGLLTLVEALTSFLAENSEVVAAAGAAYLGFLLPGLIRTAAASLALNARLAVQLVLMPALAAATTGAAGATTALAAALLSVQAVLAAGLAVAVFAGIRGWNQWQESQERAAASTQKVRDQFNAFDTQKSQQQLDGLRQKAQLAIDTSKEYRGVLGTLKLGFNEAFGDGRLGDIAAQGEAAAKTFNELSAQSRNAQTNLRAVASVSGLTVEALGEIARAQGIDLSKPFEDSADSRKQLIDYVQDLGLESEATFTSIKNQMRGDVKAALELTEAIEKVKQAVSNAFTRDTDVIGSFNVNAGVKEVEASTGRSEKAQQRLADVEASIHEKRRATAADLRRLERAREAAQKASAAAGEANARREGNSLEAAYKQALTLARGFTRDINTAIRMGLDPAVVTKLLQAGPKQAGPILERIVGDSSGRMVELVNKSETELARLNGIVVEQARLTARAVAAPTDAMTRDLSSAMRIAQGIASRGGRATARDLAHSLKLPEGEIERVAYEFGITLSNGVQAAVGARAITVPIRAEIRGGEPVYRVGGTSARARAAGGLITGPGTRTSDDIPIMASNWEFMQPAAAVDYYGVEFMEAVRHRLLPKDAVRGYRDGGLITTEGRWASPVVNVSGPRIVAVPVPVRESSTTTYDNRTVLNVDKVLAQGPDSAQRWGRTYSAMKGVS